MNVTPEAPPTIPTQFNFQGHDVRAIAKEDGSAWFVARDVCPALGFSNPSKAVADHCKSPEKLSSNDSLGLTAQANGLLIISEPDLYRLIVRANTPEAERFERWVMEEVLPTLRRTGSYTAPDSGKISRANYDLWWWAFCHLLSGRDVNAASIAAKAGMSRTTLYDIRNRKDPARRPRMQLLQKLSKAFDHTVESLVALGGQMTTGAKPSDVPFDTAAKHQAMIRGYLELDFPREQALALASRAMNHDYGTDLPEALPFATWTPTRDTALPEPESGPVTVAETDNAARFIQDGCMAAFGTKTVFSDLYDSYVLWCRYHSQRLVLSKKRLSAALRAAGFVVIPGAGNQCMVHNIEINNAYYVF